MYLAGSNAVLATGDVAAFSAAFPGGVQVVGTAWLKGKKIVNTD